MIAADGLNLELGGSVDVTVGLRDLLVPHRFLQRISIACSSYAKRCTMYRKSVRHTLALCQNDSRYDHGVFTVG